MLSLLNSSSFYSFYWFYTCIWSNFELISCKRAFFKILFSIDWIFFSLNHDEKVYYLLRRCIFSRVANESLIYSCDFSLSQSFPSLLNYIYHWFFKIVIYSFSYSSIIKDLMLQSNIWFDVLSFLKQKFLSSEHFLTTNLLRRILSKS